MKIQSSLLLGALALLSASLSLAQPSRPAAGHERPQPAGPLLVLFDINRDGVIDAEEISAASNVLASYDRNMDDALTPREIRAALGAAGFGTMAVLAVFDTNHDGVVDAEEISAATNVLASYDRNMDDALTPDELRPAAAEARAE